MPDRVDEAFLAACPKLRIIACALKGADNFDVAPCTRRGVWLTVVPDLLTVPTAELAIGLLLAVTRRFLPSDDHVRSGAFEGWRPELYGAGLNGKTLGIVGFGAVGQAIAARVATFGVTTVYSDSKSVPGEYEHVAFEKLLKMSDFVMPLVPLTTETHHLVNATALNGMKRGAYLVNVGRGSVVDEAAVADALAANYLSGYAADVFEMEDWALGARPRAIHRALLADRKRTFFTPHLGSAVDNARLAIAMEAAENVLDALACRRPRGAINNPLTARG